MVMYMKEYHDIHCSGVINVYTDHNNLIHRLSVYRVMCLKVFTCAIIRYRTCTAKSSIDCYFFSRLPLINGPSMGKN